VFQAPDFCGGSASAFAIFLGPDQLTCVAIRALFFFLAPRSLCIAPRIRTALRESGDQIERDRGLALVSPGSEIHSPAFISGIV